MLFSINKIINSLNIFYLLWIDVDELSTDNNYGKIVEKLSKVISQ